MSTIAANGLEVGYEVHGAGPPLVMLHGATSSGREDFAAQIPLLSGGFLIYAPDARGHATTPWDAADGIDAETLVDDLIGFVDALGLSTFHVLGFSMGAMTALRFAARHPARLRTLVVVGISPDREPRASVARRLMDPDRIERDDPEWAAALGARHDPVQGVGAWRRLLPTIASDVADQTLLSAADVRAIDVPTLVAVGDRDPFVPVDHAWRLQRQLRDGRLFVAPHCGHEVMARRTSLFNEAIVDFYRSTEAAARERAGSSAAVDTVSETPEGAE